MALSRLNYNSLNVTPTASKGIGFDSGADDLSIDFAGGSITFIKKLTSDGSDDDLSFVDGTPDVVLDSTYKEYMFIFNNIHPETDSTHLQFQANAAGGSGYNETMTTTHFRAINNEAGTDAYLHYHNDPAELDQAQGTAFQIIASYLGSDTDHASSGILHLYNPSSTTFVKHFMCEATISNPNDYEQHNYVAGYFNTTSAIDEIQFKMSADEIQGGTITLYGIN